MSEKIFRKNWPHLKNANFSKCWLKADGSCLSLSVCLLNKKIMFFFFKNFFKHPLLTYTNFKKSKQKTFSQNQSLTDQTNIQSTISNYLFDHKNSLIHHIYTMRIIWLRLHYKKNSSLRMMAYLWNMRCTVIDRDHLEIKQFSLQRRAIQRSSSQKLYRFMAITIDMRIAISI